VAAAAGAPLVRRQTPGAFGKGGTAPGAPRDEANEGVVYLGQCVRRGPGARAAARSLGRAAAL
jgi:hypothetical protein